MAAGRAGSRHTVQTPAALLSACSSITMLTYFWHVDIGWQLPHCCGVASHTVLSTCCAAVCLQQCASCIDSCSACRSWQRARRSVTWWPAAGHLQRRMCGALLSSCCARSSTSRASVLCTATSSEPSRAGCVSLMLQQLTAWRLAQSLCCGTVPAALLHE